MLKYSSRSKTVGPWSSLSSKDLVRVGCLRSVDTTHDTRKRATEAIRKLQGGRDKGTFRGPSDDQDDHGTTVLDRLLFFNMFKNSSLSLFRYPTLGGMRRSKKDRVLSGPRQSLVILPLKIKEGRIEKKV